MFRELRHEDNWNTRGFDLNGPLKKNHKEESYNLGEEACYVKHCSSVRPAHVGKGEGIVIFRRTNNEGYTNTRKANCPQQNSNE